MLISSHFYLAYTWAGKWVQGAHGQPTHKDNVLALRGHSGMHRNGNGIWGNIGQTQTGLATKTVRCQFINDYSLCLSFLLSGAVCVNVGKCSFMCEIIYVKAT